MDNEKKPEEVNPPTFENDRVFEPRRDDTKRGIQAIWNLSDLAVLIEERPFVEGKRS
jgi:hypothetical protein